MLAFAPTWLYIKQHNITGLKYFGKTRSDPLKYKGSGTYWNRHLKIHGNNVTTIWSKLFTDECEMINYAKNFSIENKIVESIDWANLIPESCEDGGGVKGRVGVPHTEISLAKIKAYRATQPAPMLGKHHTEQAKEKIKEKRAKQVISEESKAKRSLTMTGYVYSEERNKLISMKLKGRKYSAETIEKMRIAAKLRHQKNKGNV